MEPGHYMQYLFAVAILAFGLGVLYSACRFFMSELYERILGREDILTTLTGIILMAVGAVAIGVVPTIFGIVCIFQIWQSHPLF